MKQNILNLSENSLKVPVKKKRLQKVSVKNRKPLYEKSKKSNRNKPATPPDSGKSTITIKGRFVRAERVSEIKPKKSRSPSADNRVTRSPSAKSSRRNSQESYTSHRSNRSYEDDRESYESREHSRHSSPGDRSQYYSR